MNVGLYYLVCIKMSVTQIAVCNCEMKSILAYLLMCVHGGSDDGRLGEEGEEHLHTSDASSTGFYRAQ